MPSTSALAHVTAPTSLEDLVFPLTEAEFLQKYWNRSFLHLPGESNRYADLCSWEHVNRFLEQQPIKPPSMRLVQDGVAIPPQRYLNLTDPDFARAKPAEVAKLISHGATLELNCIDHIHPPIRNLTVALEQRFRSSAWAMFFGSWRTNKGFGLHWDHHEVFVFQIAGRKHWKVFHPTTNHPYSKPFSEYRLPQEEPVFDQVLEQGAFLYMPRGWWHVAYPLNEPSLHLSIGVKTPTGIDLLQWLIQEMSGNPALSRAVPIWNSPEERTAFAKAIIGELEKQWGPGIIESFMDARGARPRSFFDLPSLRH